MDKGGGQSQIQGRQEVEEWCPNFVPLFIFQYKPGPNIKSVDVIANPSKQYLIHIPPEDCLDKLLPDIIIFFFDLF